MRMGRGSGLEGRRALCHVFLGLQPHLGAAPQAITFRANSPPIYGVGVPGPLGRVEESRGVGMIVSPISRRWPLLRIPRAKGPTFLSPGQSEAASAAPGLPAPRFPSPERAARLRFRINRRRRSKVACADGRNAAGALAPDPQDRAPLGRLVFGGGTFPARWAGLRDHGPLARSGSGWKPPRKIAPCDGRWLLIDVPAVADGKDLDSASQILNRKNVPVIANTQAVAGPRLEFFAARRPRGFGQSGQFTGEAR